MIEIDALPPGMRDLDTLLTSIGWPSSELARRLGVSADTVADWRPRKGNSPRRNPPLTVLAWLERIDRAIGVQGPYPPGWTARRPGRPTTHGA